MSLKKTQIVGICIGAVLLVVGIILIILASRGVFSAGKSVESESVFEKSLERTDIKIGSGYQKSDAVMEDTQHLFIATTSLDNELEILDIIEYDTSLEQTSLLLTAIGDVDYSKIGGFTSFSATAVVLITIPDTVQSSFVTFVREVDGGNWLEPNNRLDQSASTNIENMTGWEIISLRIISSSMLVFIAGADEDEIPTALFVTILENGVWGIPVNVYTLATTSNDFQIVTVFSANEQRIGLQRINEEDYSLLSQGMYIIQLDGTNDAILLSEIEYGSIFGGLTMSSMRGLGSMYIVVGTNPLLLLVWNDDSNTYEETSQEYNLTEEQEQAGVGSSGGYIWEEKNLIIFMSTTLIYIADLKGDGTLRQTGAHGIESDSVTSSIILPLGQPLFCADDTSYHLVFSIAEIKSSEEEFTTQIAAYMYKAELE